MGTWIARWTREEETHNGGGGGHETTRWGSLTTGEAVGDLESTMGRAKAETTMTAVSHQAKSRRGLARPTSPALRRREHIFGTGAST